MTKVLSSIEINSSIKEVFDYMASPYNGPIFIPNLNENKNVSPEKPQVGQVFDWRFNMVGVDLVGRAEVTEFQPYNKVVISSHGDADSTWVYTLEEVGEATRVSVEITYGLAETVLQRIANKTLINNIAQKTTEQMLENLKIIIES
jgi:uncharacterized membrane protein